MYAAQVVQRVAQCAGIGGGGVEPGAGTGRGYVLLHPLCVVRGEQYLLCAGGVGYAEQQPEVAAAQQGPLAMSGVDGAQRGVGVVFAALVDDIRHEAEGEGRVYAVSAPVAEADQPAPQARQYGGGGLHLCLCRVYAPGDFRVR